jgi:alpha-D-xyloside xylohydrolase
VVDGRRWVSETHGYDSVPLRVRPGTVLPFGADDSRPDYDWSDGVTLRCFELPDGYDRETRVPGHDARGSIDGVGATTFRVRREGSMIIATTDDAHAPWALQVGDRIARAAASGEIRLEIEENAR